MTQNIFQPGLPTVDSEEPIFHSLSIEALERSNDIVQAELDKEMAELKKETAGINHRLWRLEMKKKGIIQGGCKKRKGRKKPKLRLIKCKENEFSDMSQLPIKGRLSDICVSNVGI
ncbi:MAG: hypothetical protein V1844_00130 [Pseudomonadota bacterium]